MCYIVQSLKLSDLMALQYYKMIKSLLPIQVGHVDSVLIMEYDILM